MARYIHCSNCKNQHTIAANKHGELYESLEGSAKHEMKCDGYGTIILVGNICYAAVLLDSKTHHNYDQDMLENWAFMFITV